MEEIWIKTFICNPNYATFNHVKMLQIIYICMTNDGFVIHGKVAHSSGEKAHTRGKKVHTSGKGTHLHMLMNDGFATVVAGWNDMAFGQS